MKENKLFTIVLGFGQRANILVRDEEELLELWNHDFRNEACLSDDGAIFLPNRMEELVRTLKGRMYG